MSSRQIHPLIHQCLKVKYLRKGVTLKASVGPFDQEEPHFAEAAFFVDVVEYPFSTMVHYTSCPHGRICRKIAHQSHMMLMMTLRRDKELRKLIKKRSLILRSLLLHLHRILRDQLLNLKSKCEVSCYYYRT